MTAYIIRRLLLAVPTLILTTLIVFGLMRMVPGDALVAMVADHGTVTEEQVRQFEEEHGLADPLPVQYVKWLWRLVRGDLGTSIYTGESITSALQRTAPVTIQLSVLAILLSVGFGIPLGLLAAMYRGGIVDSFTRIVSIIGLSAPEFWTGTMAITYIAIWFSWVPPQGRYTLFSSPVDMLIQLAIPATIVGYRLAAVVMRMTRSAVLEVVREDYVRTARAKGLSGSPIWLRHVLRNSMLPVLTIIAGQVVVLIGGTVIVEVIFGLPGIGRLTLDAITFRDYPLVQTIVFLLAVVVILINLLVDVSYAWLDPRIRYS